MSLTIGSSTGILIFTALFITQVAQTLALCCAIRSDKKSKSVINENRCSSQESQPGLHL